MPTVISIDEWVKNRIKRSEIEKYLDNGKPFIDSAYIWNTINEAGEPSMEELKDILDKSLSVKTLLPEETAKLLKVADRDMLDMIFDTALKVKKKVYDNRIVTFAPLYTGNLCVNNCLYCGFRSENTHKREMLEIERIKLETETLVGKIGHKRLIIVYGEHPLTDIDYIVESIRAVYSVKINRNGRIMNIRRANVNAAPLPIDYLRRIKEVGIGTYQVFQETYHPDTYRKYHPEGTLKGNYLWRLYSMHRALEAGIDDVGIGALFGLYDWRFEVMALLIHSRELERKFNVGPHTISFPRLEPALNTPYSERPEYPVGRDNFKKLVALLRLSVPHAGLILTAREDADTRREIIPLGCTQTDASTKIGIGAYSLSDDKQDKERQQFIIGDSRSLDEVVRELAEMGFITSFCTAGYRCGRTGEVIMEMLRSGKEGVFCKLNAILTFREWLDDFACPETKRVGEKLIEKEIAEVREKIPSLYGDLMKFYSKTVDGARDLYF